MLWIDFGNPIGVMLSRQFKRGGILKVELTIDAEVWVQGEVASGRFHSPEEAVQHAIDAAKLAELRALLDDAEAEGGAFSSNDVRRFVNKQLDRISETFGPNN